MQTTAQTPVSSSTPTAGVTPLNIDQAMALTQTMQQMGGTLALLQVPGRLPTSTSAVDMQAFLNGFMGQYVSLMTTVASGTSVPTPTGGTALSVIASYIGNALATLPPSTLGALLYSFCNTYAFTGKSLPVESFRTMLSDIANQTPSSPFSGQPYAAVFATMAKACFNQPSTSSSSSSNPPPAPVLNSAVLQDIESEGGLNPNSVGQIITDWQGWSSGTGTLSTAGGWGPASTVVFMQQFSPYIQTFLGNTLLMSSHLNTSGLTVGEGLSMILAGIATLPMGSGPSGSTSSTAAISIDSFFNSILNQNTGVFRMADLLPQVAHEQINHLLNSLPPGFTQLSAVRQAMTDASTFGASRASSFLNQAMVAPPLPNPPDRFDWNLSPMYVNLSGPQSSSPFILYGASSVNAQTQEEIDALMNAPTTPSPTLRTSLTQEPRV